MTAWFISDTHFGHENIIRYCGRPFANAREMDECMIERWNARVRPEDTVWHLGDFMLGPLEYVRDVAGRLNGCKNLIRGNHDRHSSARYIGAGFKRIERSRIVEVDGIIVGLCHNVRRLPDTWMASPVEVMLCGHVHGRGYLKAPYYDVSVEATGYRPMTLKEIVER